MRRGVKLVEIHEWSQTRRRAETGGIVELLDGCLPRGRTCPRQFQTYFNIHISPAPYPTSNAPANRTPKHPFPRVTREPTRVTCSSYTERAYKHKGKRGIYIRLCVNLATLSQKREQRNGTRGCPVLCPIIRIGSDCAICDFHRQLYSRLWVCHYSGKLNARSSLRV